MPVSTERPFRFALQSVGAPTASDWRDLARRAEDLGYSTLQLADHFLGPGPLQEESGMPVHLLAPIPAMAAAAMVTSTLRIGCRVFCVDYRVPALLAHELASLDVLSDGRLEIGLGAGWFSNEYAAAGLTLDPPGARIARLEALVRALKAFFAGEQLAIEDGPVTMTGYRATPPAIQRPHPPFLIGGGGPRVLRLAAREADIVSINSNQSSGKVHEDAMASSGAAQTDEQVRIVKEAAGARFADVELELGAHFTVVTDSTAASLERLAARVGSSPEVLADHPHVLLGSVDRICEQLLARRERYGASYVTVFSQLAEKFAPVVERLSGV